MADDVRWLSAQERAAWLGITGLLMKLPTQLDTQLEADEKLNFFEYMVLALLSETPDHTRQMSDLASITSASLSRLSHAAKRLEDQGFLVRQRLPGPGRRTSASLTELGHAKVVAAAPGHLRRVRELIIDIATAEELAAMQSVGEKVLRAIDGDPECLS
ncbi:MAG: MarR family winged helix-turn-helix transcriptional regulator [Nocardioides sp.]